MRKGLVSSHAECLAPDVKLGEYGAALCGERSIAIQLKVRLQLFEREVVVLSAACRIGQFAQAVDLNAADAAMGSLVRCLPSVSLLAQRLGCGADAAGGT
jgi:hypothetical protein